MTINKTIEETRPAPSNCQASPQTPE
jgi:hypothetical protein